MLVGARREVLRMLVQMLINVALWRAVDGGIYTCTRKLSWLCLVAASYN